MNKQIKALKMIINWIESDSDLVDIHRNKLKVCKEALAEAEKQEDYPSKEEILNKIFDAVYTQYPKKEWQSLSDDEIQNELKNMWDKGLIPSYSIVEFARAIEQALRERNCNDAK